MKLRITSPVLFAICAFVLGGYVDFVMLLHGGLHDFVAGTILTQLFSMVMLILFLVIFIKQEAAGESNLFAFCLFLMTFCLQSTSAISYPRQADKSSFTLETVTIRQDAFLVQTVVFFTVFLAVSFVLHFNRVLDRYIRKVVFGISAVNLGFGGYFSIRGGKMANIGGLVVGLPLLAWMLFAFSAYHTFYRHVSYDGDQGLKQWDNTDKRTTILMIVSALLLMFGFVRTHEYGILFYFALSVTAWIFFEPHKTIKTLKQRILWYGCSLAAVVLAVIGAAVTYHVYQSAYDSVLTAGEIPQGDIDNYVSELSVMHHFGSKVARIFLDTGLKFVRSAGVFGSPGYVYDIAANNDYALGLQIHNFGLLWLLVLVILLLLYCMTGCICLSNSDRERSSTADTLKFLSFFCILLLVLYPISSNIGLTAIIGVSAYCAGYSGMHAVLCAFLMAAVLYERHERR